MFFANTSVYRTHLRGRTSGIFSLLCARVCTCLCVCVRCFVFRMWFQMSSWFAWMWFRIWKHTRAHMRKQTNVSYSGRIYVVFVTFDLRRPKNGEQHRQTRNMITSSEADTNLQRLKTKSACTFRFYTSSLSHSHSFNGESYIFGCPRHFNSTPNSFRFSCFLFCIHMELNSFVFFLFNSVSVWELRNWERNK